jgi:histone H3/H4|tara:strand:+ start:2336 stop:2731 length:396 start_codon:yes stop_codon:yes gene_type:complete
MEPHDFSSAAINIITPVFENAVMLSGHYARACGRSTILAKDMEYCMKYCAMHTIGDKIGSYFPEIYDSDGSDIDDIEIVDEEDEDAFEPYQGSNVAMKAITEAYDAWESWVPTNPSERMVKNAIDSNEHLA